MLKGISIRDFQRNITKRQSEKRVGGIRVTPDDGSWRGRSQVGRQVKKTGPPKSGNLPSLIEKFLVVPTSCRQSRCHSDDRDARTPTPSPLFPSLSLRLSTCRAAATLYLSRENQNEQKSSVRKPNKAHKVSGPSCRCRRIAGSPVVGRCRPGWRRRWSPSPCRRWSSSPCRISRVGLVLGKKENGEPLGRMSLGERGCKERGGRKNKSRRKPATCS